MKLVRVLSKENQATASFSNLFTDQITIPPYSQVALINASLSLTTITVNVNSGNNTFTFKNSDRGTQYTAALRLGDYSSTAFLTELNRAINSQIPFTNQGNRNYQWTATTAGNNVLSLAWANSKSDSLQQTEFNDGVSVNTSFNTVNSGIVGVEALGAEGRSFWYANSDIPFTFGSGQLSAKINCIGGFGLMKASNLPTDTMDDTHVVFGIFCNANETYDVVINGVRTTTSETSTSTLIPAIQLSEGKVSFIEDTATGTLLVDDVNFTYDGVTLLPFAQVQGKYASGLSILNMKWNRDPSVSLGNIGSQTSKPSLTFTSGSRVLLGFTTDSVTLPSPVSSFTFVGNNAIIDSTPPVSLSVELPQLGSMESYDGKTERRAQLVSVIPSLVKTNQDMSYNAPYPIFVDINNAYDIVLSSLEVRVLDSATNSPVALENPACSLTFAFKSRKE